MQLSLSCPGRSIVRKLLFMPLLFIFCLWLSSHVVDANSNYQNPTFMMKELKTKYRKLISSGINTAWVNNEPSELLPEYMTEPSPGNLSYMILEIYDDEDCAMPVMHAGQPSTIILFSFSF
jgi:hypothetical protein